MKAVLAALIVFAGASSSGFAQSVPFDMTRERPDATEDTPFLQAPVPESEAAEEVEPGPLAPPAVVRRLLLPSGSITLAGETASRSWGFHLTSTQAASPATFQLGYRNAVVVAPEGSNIQVLINQVPVLEEAVRSAESFSQASVKVPAGLLRTGRNEITIRARQRHRTDCTIQSTYDLWTEIDSARTLLSFSDENAATHSAVADLRAIAADAQGRARITIVAPGMDHSDISADLLRLAQAIALHASLPNLDFSISATPDSQSDGGALRVLLGSVEELAEIADIPSSASTGPYAAFAPVGADGVPVLLITGRNRADWLAAIDMVLEPVDRPEGGARETLTTDLWRIPSAPMFYGQRSLSLAELGIRSEQFSGRRYVNGFQFAVPGDFYAGSYGQARFLLDAAFSDMVRPGSLINIYVNGSIATSIPLTQTSGAILSRFPVEMTMRHFRPGLNDIVIEAILLTRDDEACLPGATADDTARFALFDTSRFDLPNFARIGQRPNLDAFAAVAYPYGFTSEPISVVIERGDRASLSAAANVFARMALSAGRVVPLTLAASANGARDRDAIFFGTINSVPQGVLQQVGVDETSRVGWSVLPEGVAGAQDGRRIDVEAWRQEMESRGAANWLRDVQNWFQQTFDIREDMLRFAPPQEIGFVPAQSSVLIAAQGENPAGSGVWTVIAAPDDARLMQGASAVARQQVWQNLSGHISSLDSDYAIVISEPTTTFTFVETQSPSFRNYRLIAANWLSANILSYSLALVTACVVLGIMTSALLSQLGRRR